MNKIKISFLNKIIILTIIIIFSFLFYLSLPALYDYEKVQSQLKVELLNNFNLNAQLSKTINYRILPAPHFEINDSKIFSKEGEEKEVVGEIKKIKIYVEASKIYSQKKLKIKNIVITNSVFNFNIKNLQFINGLLQNLASKKKIIIKKSKFFFKDKNETIAIVPINNFNFYYSEKKLLNIVSIFGTVFNSKFNLYLTKDFSDENKINFVLKFPASNLSMKNSTKKIKEKDNKLQIYNTINTIHFFGSEIKTEIDWHKDHLQFSSIKSKIFNKKFDYDGLINFDPFFLTININAQEWSWKKILTNEIITSILINNDNNDLIHSNLNSQIVININSFTNNKFLDTGKLFIESQNGKIKFDNSFLILKDIGDVNFLDTKLFSSNRSVFIKSNIIINVKNNKKFYNTFQVPLKYRKEIKKISFSIEKNLSTNSTIISKFSINSKFQKELDEKLTLIVSDANLNILKNSYNWIEFKNFIKYIIQEFK